MYKSLCSRSAKSLGQFLPECHIEEGMYGHALASRNVLGYMNSDIRPFIIHARDCQKRENILSSGREIQFSQALQILP